MGAVKTKRMPRAVREQQMLDAAVLTFGRRGYTAASMDEIAELAGVSKPLVYLYLNSKEDLFLACIRREAAALADAIRTGVRPGAPADRQLWDGLRAFFAHTAQHPDGWSVLHLQARTHGEAFAAEAAAVRAEIVAFVTQLIAAAAREKPAGSPEGPGCARPGGRSGVGARAAFEAGADAGGDTADVAGDTADVAGDTADVGGDTADVGGDTADVGGDTADVAGAGADLPEREIAGLAEALVGAAESLADRANATPGVTARQTAATLMNFAWAGLGSLLRGRPWSPPGPDEPDIT